MKEQISKITLDCMMGIREGVGRCRVKEFNSYIENLIQIKEAGIDVNTIQFPMLSDRVKQGVEAALSSKSEVGVEGGATWQIATLGASYGKEKQQGIKVNVSMEFMSVGSPDFTAIQALSVEDLKKLMEVVND